MTSPTSDATSVLGELLNRRSCRAFRPDPVPRAVIEQVLTLAQRTPSWCNVQPWHVEITEGAGTDRFRAGLSEHVRNQPHEPDFAFPPGYHGVYRQRRRDTAAQLYSSLGIAADDRQGSLAQTMKNFDLFGAPHVAIVTTERSLGVYGAIDCGLYINTFLLAAEGLGVATVPQAALAGSARFIREFFALPESRQVVCAISFGYADPEHPANTFRTTRADIDTAATWVC